MDITKERLKVTCNGCQNKIVVTFNTIQCPKCGTKYDAEEVHNLFYNYETQLANSKAYNFGEKAEKTSKATSSFGDWIQTLGCLIFFIPGTIFLIFILKALLQ